ncbi:ParB/Srx family N-terminal domain-containing protein [Endozoicomonas sp. SESOKO4]|uniref:ParB/Srx family N-terminal domain-containing protein n=1 Tax=Endozoicomonas sp. SESOKO4 TaxID=2828745 RepID=UPI0021474582|nr:ParB/Srx family N-terminal domain-containing protein [Endozoicomonas sp. SESOKO4]
MSKRISTTLIDQHDTRYQVRDNRTGSSNDAQACKAEEEQHIKRIVEAIREGKRLPPIDVVKGENGKYVIVDGWHRFKAQKKLKRPQIQVDVLENVSLEHYFNLNSEHKGRPLTAAQTIELKWQKFLVKTLKENSKATNSELVGELGIAVRTLQSWRKLLKDSQKGDAWEDTQERNEITGYPIKEKLSQALKHGETEFTPDNGLNEEEEKVVGKIHQLLSGKGIRQEAVVREVNAYYLFSNEFEEEGLEEF